MKFLKFLAFCIVFLALGITLVNVADLQKANTNLNNQLQQQEQTYSGKIDELTVYQEKLVERISLLEENYSKLQTAYDELKAAYDQYLLDSTLEREQLQTTVTSLNATIVELEQNSDVDAETITALRSEVSTLETSLENQTTTANQLQATVIQQEATIVELNATIDALIEELNSDLSGGIYKEIFEGTVTEITAEDLEGVTEIRPYAFYDLDSLISIELPNVTTIGRSAFEICRNLTTVIVPNCEVIRSFAFGGCSNLTNFTFSSSLRAISEGAFNNCESLVNLSFASTRLDYIGANAFALCQSLSSIELPDTLFSIEAEAFWGCYSLESLTIPEGVRMIGSDFLVWCSLKTLTINAITPPTYDAPALNGGSMPAIPDSVTTIYIPAGTFEAYSNADVWKDYADRFVELSA